ncbi:hypothetical protein VTL71DRAFT_1218 [Oculimacula yallundae]|uniref:Uncharacterized protein n=1 Tax=Oculimacula yallundae TaxID=86028 RepID=A0ABR4CA92_9HELO
MPFTIIMQNNLPSPPRRAFIGITAIFLDGIWQTFIAWCHWVSNWILHVESRFWEFLQRHETTIFQVCIIAFYLHTIFMAAEAMKIGGRQRDPLNKDRYNHGIGVQRQLFAAYGDLVDGEGCDSWDTRHNVKFHVSSTLWGLIQIRMSFSVIFLGKLLGLWVKAEQRRPRRARSLGTLME